MLKLLIELGPLLVFFATYKYANIFLATIWMITATAACLLVSYLVDKKISMVLLISGFILLISGSITLLTGDSMYIKMKPTLVYIIFCIILWIGARKNQKPFISYVLGSAFKMEDAYWIVLSRRFAFYFFMMAVINEVVWRNFAESFWVNFKVFGAIPITLLFTVTQVPFLMRHHIVEPDSNKSKDGDI
jgi:intracellular septation protein